MATKIERKPGLNRNGEPKTPKRAHGAQKQRRRERAAARFSILSREEWAAQFVGTPGDAQWYQYRERKMVEADALGVS